MEIRHAVHPDQAMMMDTSQLRKNFLIEDLFIENRIKMIYSYYDRLIIGGVVPTKELKMDVDPAIIGTEQLLDRREMGIINIGGPGEVSIGGEVTELDYKDGLYVGMGQKNLAFASLDEKKPAKFYFNCATAHTNHPTAKVTFETAEPTHLGENAKSNKRTIRKYFHPEGVRSCQLVMGVTSLDTGCVWNTMPVHTHERRMEAYLYFDLSEDDILMHFMGAPDETRHLVVRNEQVALSPSWSIHSGAGTRNYTFIWGMVGENQTFTDMDWVDMADLK